MDKTRLDDAAIKVLYEAYEALNKAGGTALGLAMSTEHPDPDAALTEIFQACQAASGKLADLLRGQERQGKAAGRPDGEPMEFGYTNWRGVFGYRKAIPMDVREAATEWHPRSQWLLRAWDTEKDAERDFALADFFGRLPPGAADPAHAKALLDAEDVAATAAAEALVPLEAIVSTGADAVLPEELRQAVAAGIASVSAMAAGRADRLAAAGFPSAPAAG